MADYVQALELQISSDSTKAVESLNKLAASLRKIRGTINGTMKTFGASSAVVDFADSLKKLASNDNISGVNKLADAMENLAKQARALRDVKSALAAVKKATAGTVTGRGAVEQAAEYVRHRRHYVGRHEQAYFSAKQMEETREVASRVAEGYTEATKRIEGAAQAVRLLAGESEGLKRLYGSTGRGPLNITDEASRDAFRISREEADRLRRDAIDVSEGFQTSVGRVREVGMATQQAAENIKLLEAGVQRANDRFTRLAGSGVMFSRVGSNTAGSFEGEAQIVEGLKREQQARQENLNVAVETTKEAVRTKREAAELAQKYIDGKMNTAVVRQQIAHMREDLRQAKEEAAMLRSELQGGLRTGTLSPAGASGIAARIHEADDAVKKLENDIKELEKSTSVFSRVGETIRNAFSRAASAVSGIVEKTGEAMKKFSGALFTGNGLLSTMFGRLKSIVMYRGLRALLRQVTEGFKTGLENVREYSKAINGLYAQDMAGLDNTLLKMKNSLGAALAPAIRSLIPLFQTLANWVITVSNYLNQFFALIAGQTTWTRAVEVDAAALEDQQNAANGASKAMKNLLASWDELNIIQSQSGGGGSGGNKLTEEDYLNMFEEVEVFDQKVRDAITWMKENLDLVYATLGYIALTLAGFTTGGAVAVISIAFSFKTGMEVGQSGGDFLTALKDSLKFTLGSALGGAIIGWNAGGPTLGDKAKGALLGLVVGASISLIATFVGWVRGKSATEEDFIKNMIGSIIVALPSALLGMVIGGVVAGPAGGAIGFTLGAVLGLALQGLFWEETEGLRGVAEKAFGKHLQSTLLTILPSAISLAIMGGVVAGPGGAVAMFTLGAVIGLANTLLFFDEDSSTAQADKSFADNIIDIVRDGFAIIAASGILGLKFGGVTGGIIGAIVGVGISVAVWSIKRATRAEEDRKAREAEFARVVEEVRTEIQDDVSRQVFGADVVAQINVVNAEIEDLDRAKTAVEEAKASLEGTWRIDMALGLGNLTGTQLEELNTKAQALVSSISTYLRQQRTVVELGVGLFGATMSESDVEGAATVSQALLDQEQTVLEIGHTLGEILARGTTEGYETVVESIMNTLSGLAEIATTSQAQAAFHTAVMEAGIDAETEDGRNSVQRMTGYQAAFNEAKNELVTAAASQVAAAYEANLEAFNTAQYYAGMTNDELASMGITTTREEWAAQAEELERVLADYRTNYRTHIDTKVQELLDNNNAEILYAVEMLTLWEAIGEEFGGEGGLYDSNGNLKSAQELVDMARAGGLSYFDLNNAEAMLGFLALGLSERRRTGASGGTATVTPAVAEEVSEWVAPAYGEPAASTDTVPDSARAIISALYPDVTGFYGVAEVDGKQSYIVGTADGYFAIDANDINGISLNSSFGTPAPSASAALTAFGRSDLAGGQYEDDQAYGLGLYFRAADGRVFGTAPDSYTKRYVQNGRYVDNPYIQRRTVNASDFPGLIPTRPEAWSVPREAYTASDLYDYIVEEIFNTPADIGQVELADITAIVNSIFGDQDWTDEVSAELRARFPSLFGDDGYMTLEAYNALAELMENGGYNFLETVNEMNRNGGVPSGTVPAGATIGVYGVNNGVVYAGGGGAPIVDGGPDDENAEEGNRILRQIANIAERIANKEFKVDLKPSSQSGAMFAKSIDMYNRAKG